MTGVPNYRPGDHMDILDRNGARHAIVLASSRHSYTYDQAKAARELVQLYEAEGDECCQIQTWTFYSHTAKAAEYGCLGDCEAEPGFWCTEGDGKAWRRVLVGYPVGEAAVAV